MFWWLTIALACSPANIGGEPRTNDNVLGPGDLPWTPPEAWGPFPVSVDTIDWVDERGKEMVAEVWFPAVAEDNAVLRPYSPLTLTAHAWARLNPDVRFAPYPLVAFSHGFTGIRFQSLFLAEFLASHGLVVVAPDHRYNTFLDMNNDHMIQVILERPGDVISAVDELYRRAGADDNELFGLVGSGNYAVVGHSFGAFTSMIVGGGEVDINGAIARCDAGQGQLCADIRQIRNEDIEAHAMTDERAVVTVPMSPGIWYAFGPDGQTAPGLRRVRTPLVLAGDSDGVLRYQEEELPSFEAMGTGKVLATFHGAGHYGFSDLCLLAPFLSDECAGSNDGWMEVSDVQRITQTVALAHIRHHLVGEIRDVPWLAQNWLVDEPLVTTTMD